MKNTLTPAEAADSRDARPVVAEERGEVRVTGQVALADPAIHGIEAEFGLEDGRVFFHGIEIVHFRDGAVLRGRGIGHGVALTCMW